MGLILWESALETGHARIDEQHEVLVKACNSLYLAISQDREPEEVGRILAFLREYTATHFRMEENLMDATAYPGKDRHKGIHLDLLVQMADLVDQQKKGAALTAPITKFLEDWLVFHIQGEDCRLAAWLNRGA